MNNQDSDLKKLFATYRENDLKTHEIPEFKLPKKQAKQSGIMYLKWFTAAAATITAIVLLSSKLNNANNISTSQDITIELSIDPTINNTTSLQKDPDDIYSWSASSDVLINEFE